MSRCFHSALSFCGRTTVIPSRFFLLHLLIICFIFILGRVKDAVRNLATCVFTACTVARSWYRTPLLLTMACAPSHQSALGAACGFRPMVYLELPHLWRRRSSANLIPPSPGPPPNQSDGAHQIVDLLSIVLHHFLHEDLHHIEEI